jgi:hypothetical protein
VPDVIGPFQRLQQPAAWEYTIDPVTGNSKATYIGEVNSFGTLIIGSPDDANPLILSAGSDATDPGGIAGGVLGIVFNNPITVTSSENRAELHLISPVENPFWPAVIMSGPPGSTRQVTGQTSGLRRWQFQLGNGAAETGGNAGSDVALFAFDDAGNPMSGGTTPAILVARATGNMTVNGAQFTSTGDVYAGTNTLTKHFYLNGTTGTHRILHVMTAGVNRWVIGANGSTAETGSNAGSDFMIKRYDDNGGQLDNPLTIARATGYALFNGAVGFNNVPAVARPTVTGSRGANTALASLITAIAATGLIIDSTTA